MERESKSVDQASRLESFLGWYQSSGPRAIGASLEGAKRTRRKWHARGHEGVTKRCAETVRGLCRPVCGESWCSAGGRFSPGCVLRLSCVSIEDPGVFVRLAVSWNVNLILSYFPRFWEVVADRDRR